MAGPPTDAFLYKWKARRVRIGCVPNPQVASVRAVPNRPRPSAACSVFWLPYRSLQWRLPNRLSIICQARACLPKFPALRNLSTEKIISGRPATLGAAWPHRWVCGVKLIRPRRRTTVVWLSGKPALGDFSYRRSGFLDRQRSRRGECAARRAARRERHGRRDVATERRGRQRPISQSERGPRGPYGALKRACEEWGDRNLPRPCASDAAD